MIISRTPMRISLFGGGTDFPIWYKENGGSVISSTINKYTFVNIRYLPPFFDFKYCIRYYKREETKNIASIKHPTVRECLKYLKINKGVEIIHNADLPAMSGLGSSSSFTVGLLNSINALQGKYVTKKELAYDAIKIEQTILKESVGSQDQVAAAFGGLNKIDFIGEDITVSPIIIEKNNLLKLESNFLLYFTGLQRKASKIEKLKIRQLSKHKNDLIEMNELTNEAFKHLNNFSNINDIGHLLNEQWELKKSLSEQVSNSLIDDIYNKGIKAGALGGKLLGAGGGGFILFYVENKNKENVKKKLKQHLHVPFRFDFSGSQIIYYSHSESAI